MSVKIRRPTNKKLYKELHYDTYPKHKNRFHLRTIYKLIGVIERKNFQEEINLRDCNIYRYNADYTYNRKDLCDILKILEKCYPILKEKNNTTIRFKISIDDDEFDYEYCEDPIIKSKPHINRYILNMEINFHDDEHPEGTDYEYGECRIRFNLVETCSVDEIIKDAIEIIKLSFNQSFISKNSHILNTIHNKESFNKVKEALKNLNIGVYVE